VVLELGGGFWPLWGGLWFIWGVVGWAGEGRVILECDSLDRGVLLDWEGAWRRRGGDSLVGSSKPRANAGVAVDRWIWGGPECDSMIGMFPGLMVRIFYLFRSP